MHWSYSWARLWLFVRLLFLLVFGFRSLFFGLLLLALFLILLATLVAHDFPP